MSCHLPCRRRGFRDRCSPRSPCRHRSPRTHPSPTRPANSACDVRSPESITYSFTPAPVPTKEYSVIERQRCADRSGPDPTGGSSWVSSGGHDGLGIDLRHVGETADVLQPGGVEGDDESEHRPVPDIDWLDAEAAQLRQRALQRRPDPGPRRCTSGRLRADADDLPSRTVSRPQCLGAMRPSCAVRSRTSWGGATGPADAAATINVATRPRRAPANPHRDARRIPNPFSPPDRFSDVPASAMYRSAEPGISRVAASWRVKSDGISPASERER